MFTQGHLAGIYCASGQLQSMHGRQLDHCHLDSASSTLLFLTHQCQVTCIDDKDIEV